MLAERAVPARGLVDGRPDRTRGGAALGGGRRRSGPGGDARHWLFAQRPFSARHGRSVGAALGRAPREYSARRPEENVVSEAVGTHRRASKNDGGRRSAGD